MAHGLHLQKGHRLAIFVDHVARNHPIRRHPEHYVRHALFGIESQRRAPLHVVASAVFGGDKTGAGGRQPVLAWLDIGHAEFAG